MGEGLAAHVTNMYGNDGDGNTVRHYYAGQRSKSKTKKKEGSKNGK